MTGLCLPGMTFTNASYANLSCRDLDAWMRGGNMNPQEHLDGCDSFRDKAGAVCCRENPDWRRGCMTGLCINTTVKVNFSLGQNTCGDYHSSMVAGSFPVPA